jgi:hypothetical protein
MTAQAFQISANARLEYEYGVASLVYTERSQDYWHSDTETDIDLNAEQISEMIAWLQGVQAARANQMGAPW